MRDTLTPAAKQITSSRKRKQAWQKVVRSLAMIVVFCTTYALILPAITMQSDAICGMEAHAHTEDCFRETPVTALVCTLPEDEEHQHEETCWEETGEIATELICTLAEHTHTESCYPLEEEKDQVDPFRCGYAQHVHHDGCSAECTIAEHIHEARCLLDDVDLTADVETQADWEQMAAALPLTGDWNQDLLILAERQMGYAESKKNVVLSGETLYGYSRYGDWFGNPYMNWDAAFVAFCMNYAGIPEDAIPRSSDTERWLKTLEDKSLVADPHNSLPQPGSIVICKDSEGNLFSAIVQKLETEKSNLDKMSYRLIAGDIDGKVGNCVVQLKDITAVCDPNLIRSGGNAQQTEAGEKNLVHTAETENYIVTVTCGEGVVLPEGAQLQVMEYAKDSETYIRRCEEAGYELEWLLNIGFFLDGTELTVEGGFNVEVVSKQGTPLGGDITHFADSGTELLEGDTDDESVSFVSDSFSDFGGGNAARAVSSTYNLKTVDANNLKTGTDYVAFVIWRNQNNRQQIVFLSSSGSELTPIIINNINGITNNGATWSLTSSQLTGDSSNFTWRLTRSNNNSYLTVQSSKQNLGLYNGWVTLDNGTPLVFQDKGTGAVVGSYGSNGRQFYGLRYANSNGNDYMWRGGWYNDSGQQVTTGDTIYFAEITYDEPASPPDTDGSNYPHAVHTGEVTINRLRFYNLCENGSDIVSGLAGCEFEITGPDGTKYTVTSSSSSEVMLPEGLPDGTYTIEETKVPDGYVRDVNPVRTFVMEDGNLSSEGNIGTFVNHNIQQIATDKTAEVEDYANRIYKVDLSANSNMREYELEPIDVLFVVDQSNSMLFPAHLISTGKTVSLRSDGVGNDAEMNAHNLDPNQVYYVIADPTTSSTVWAIWYDGKAWACQDASYYAKAKHENGPGYGGNEIVYFPDSSKSYATLAAEDKNSSPKKRCNGSGLAQNLTGGTLGDYIALQDGAVCEFVLYTSSNEYNRLHYLQEALANIIYQLADANGENRVALTRFTKIRDITDCDPLLELSTAYPDTNPNDGFDVATYADHLVQSVGSIQTSGGTRQDYALEHISNKHLDSTGEHYKGVGNTYTLLITDGAPVSSDSHTLGTPNSTSTTGEPSTGANGANTIYGRIKGWGAEVRKESTLLTVGLGMENVQGGKQVLQEIASSGDWFSAMDDASKLKEFVQKLLFESFRASGSVNVTGDIVDEISNSFYPIAYVDNAYAARDRQRIEASGSSRIWVLLEAGDWITLNGKLTSAGASNAAGQLLQREDGTYYVQWLNQTISGAQWNGTVYVKAKEDFIGGNAIDTNKSNAVVTATVYRSNGEALQSVVREMETPNVNVRLLDLNEFHSEVTVYLGDRVNAAGNAPIDSLKGFYDGTVFTKLISDGGDVLNKVTAASSETDGLEEAVFYLRYAMGRDLSEKEWTLLQNGESITVEYVYDNASSHGNVGYFTISLEKQGNLTYLEHDAHTACQPSGTAHSESCSNPVEVYTLNVTYTAYRLADEKDPNNPLKIRPANVHNGTDGPGTEVGSVDTTLEKGKGVVDKENIHEVHVISGKIEIWKYFAEGIRDPKPRTFTFNLNKIEDGVATVVASDTITIKAGQTAGEGHISFEDLPRGTYTVTEASDEQYAVTQIQVRDETNCYSIPGKGGTAKELTFVMGNDPENKDVIGYVTESDAYTSYIHSPDGVYGAAAFTNGERTFEAEIPVEKVWDDGSDKHQLDQVYLVLYLNESPVVDVGGNARILRLDHSSEWKGSFTVPLTGAEDSLSNYNYSVREVSKVRSDNPGSWNPAVLENDGSTLLYYEHAVEQGMLIYASGYSYVVTYLIGTDGKITVNNSVAVTLPKTGGLGTAPMYTIGGLLITAAACVCGYDQRRKHRREAVE